MLIVILTNNSCQLFVPVFSHISVNMRWSIRMRLLQLEVFFEVERSDDLKGYLFLDMKQWSHGLTVPWYGTCGIVDVVKGYLFLDALLQLTEAVLLLLRQLPIWTLHRLAWDVSIINLCTRINIDFRRYRAQPKIFHEDVDWLESFAIHFNAFAGFSFSCSVYKPICYVFSSFCLNKNNVLPCFEVSFVNGRL